MLIAQQSSQGSIWPTIGMFALLFGLMYLLFIRPQSKRRREAEQMQRKIGPGDKIVTIGGLYATVVGTDDESVTLELSPGVNARYARQAIARVTERVDQPEAAAEADEVDEPTDVPVSSPIEESKKRS
ncbi:MAG TPA: preprotein translocase subunit YajC [Candidatus Limnocylindrales bacterium]